MEIFGSFVKNNGKMRLCTRYILTSLYEQKCYSWCVAFRYQISSSSLLSSLVLSSSTSSSNIVTIINYHHQISFIIITIIFNNNIHYHHHIYITIISWHHHHHHHISERLYVHWLPILLHIYYYDMFYFLYFKVLWFSAIMNIWSFHHHYEFFGRWV